MIASNDALRPAPADVVEMYRGVLDVEAGREWDEFVLGLAPSDITQLGAWADTRGLAGFDRTYLMARSRGVLVGGAQILHRPVPGLGRLGYVAHGPLVAEGHDRLLGALARALGDFTRANLRFLVVQPALECPAVGSALVAAGFRPSSATIAPRASLRVDLTAPESEIVARFSRRLRTWTRQWPARGVSVRIGDHDDVPLLAELMARSARHQGFVAFDVAYLRALYNRLSAEGWAVLLVGEVRGTPVAAELFTGCGSVLTARFCGLDRSRKAQQLNVANAVTWEGIRLARARGYQWLDLGGIGSASARALHETERSGTGRDDLVSTDAAKVKFGGVLVDFPPPLEMAHPAVLSVVIPWVRRSAAGSRLVDRIAVHLRGRRA